MTEWSIVFTLKVNVFPDTIGSNPILSVTLPPRGVGRPPRGKRLVNYKTRLIY